MYGAECTDKKVAWSDGGGTCVFGKCVRSSLVGRPRKSWIDSVNEEKRIFMFGKQGEWCMAVMNDRDCVGGECLGCSPREEPLTLTV